MKASSAGSALLALFCIVMATIQVRNVPSDVHRTYQVRAASAGMSIQEYLLAELTRNARMRSPAELVAEVDQRLRFEDSAGFAGVGSTDIVREDGESH